MKYKVGDKIRIKENFIFNKRANFYMTYLDKLTTTIRNIKNDKYFLKGLVDMEWEEQWLEEIDEPINSRFEILDL